MRPRVSARLIVLLALVAALALPAAAQAGTGKAGASEHKDNPTIGGCAKKRSGKKKCQNKNPGPKVGTAASDCPSGGTECHIDITVNQASPTTGGICDSFEDVGSGVCIGPTYGTPGWNSPSYFPQYGIQSWFSWESQGPQRNVEYLAKASYTIVEAVIHGNVPAPSSAVFNVTDAYNRSTGTHWQTVSTGGAPGTKGGPLYIDYNHRVLGSSVHIWGWMVRK